VIALEIQNNLCAAATATTTTTTTTASLDFYLTGYFSQLLNVQLYPTKVSFWKLSEQDVFRPDASLASSTDGLL